MSGSGSAKPSRLSKVPRLKLMAAVGRGSAFFSDEQRYFAFCGVGEEGGDAPDFYAVPQLIFSDAQHIHAHLTGDDFDPHLPRHLRQLFQRRHLLSLHQRPQQFRPDAEEVHLADAQAFRPDGRHQGEEFFQKALARKVTPLFEGV